jgi:fatty acid desaturase
LSPTHSENLSAQPSELSRTGGMSNISQGEDLDELARGFMWVKATLVDSSGIPFKNFRHTLRPRYGIVWTEFLSGYLALVVITAGLIAVRGQSRAWVVIASVVGAVLIGYIFHYLSLFQHAAAHFNLAADKSLNDLLANLLFGALFGYGYGIKSYRAVHFEHHRRLGTPADTENGYILPFNWEFLLRSATGLTMWEKIFNRSRPLTQYGSAQKIARRLGPFSVIAALLHSTVALGSLYLGHYALAGAWVLGVISFFPLFMGVRLTLEHRSLDAKTALDYSQQPHGALSRIFGSGPLSSTFGAAGFNRHLLHHWEPQVPYERLKDLERYLRDTMLATELNARTTSYTTAFRQLFRR